MTSGALCRMCVEEAEPLIDIFGDFGREQQIGQIVAQHFWFEVSVGLIVYFSLNYHALLFLGERRRSSVR